MQGATGAMLGCTVLCYIHSLDRDHTAYYKHIKNKEGLDCAEKPPTPLMGQQDLLWRKGPSKLKGEPPSDRWQK